jgi:hypothetical protein
MVHPVGPISRARLSVAPGRLVSGAIDSGDMRHVIAVDGAQSTDTMWLKQGGQEGKLIGIIPIPTSIELSC